MDESPLPERCTLVRFLDRISKYKNKHKHEDIFSFIRQCFCVFLFVKFGLGSIVQACSYD